MNNKLKILILSEQFPLCRYQKLLGYLFFDPFSDPDTLIPFIVVFPFFKSPFRLEGDLPLTPNLFVNVLSTDKWQGVTTHGIARKMLERRGRRCRYPGENSKRKIELSSTRL